MMMMMICCCSCSRPIHVSFDVDAIDPVSTPSTGTAGLSIFDFTTILGRKEVVRCLQLRFDLDSTLTRPLYDHSTTYIMTIGLPAAAMRPK